MDIFSTLHNDVVKINQDLYSLIKQGRSITEMSDYSFDVWEKTCQSIEKQLSEEVLRVAVVGAVKSGKSTFTNYLFKGDYLKRGAGVITSIVTRVRRSQSLEAKLYFKSWNEINRDIEQALKLLPLLHRKPENAPFDLRDEQNRSDLEQILQALGPDALQADGYRNANSVLLSSYLKGYERVESFISLNTHVHRFKNDAFSKHLPFVSEDALAVYLDDVQLEINTGDMTSDVEIADCQGSDSPNPLHLAMIQDYLLFTHLIVYVVSSRTGLRQADIRFLTIIKKMGLLENIVFIINCDFSEHETIDSLNKLATRIKEEISLIKTDPEIYCFSSLYHLFKIQKNQLSQRDRMRLAQWESEKAFTDFSEGETARFNSAFHHKLTTKRYALLINNHIERLGILSTDLNHWAQLNKDILSSDGDKANMIIEKIKDHQEKMRQVETVIKSSLDGAVHYVKEELKSTITQFFNRTNTGVINLTLSFIERYHLPLQQYEQPLRDIGFTHTLYRVFEDFKQTIDKFITEEVNPEIIRFIKEKTKWVGTYLHSVSAPYDVIIRDTLTEYDLAMTAFGMNRKKNWSEKIEFQDVENIRSGLGLRYPISATILRYSTKVRTEATLRLGFYKIVRALKNALKKPVSNKNDEGMRALQDGIHRMKRETKDAVMSHFIDNRENIKFQYFFKLADATAENCHQMLLGRFQIYTGDLSQLAGMINRKELDRESTIHRIAEIVESSVGINHRIAELKRTAIQHL